MDWFPGKKTPSEWCVITDHPIEWTLLLGSWDFPLQNLSVLIYISMKRFQGNKNSINLWEVLNCYTILSTFATTLKMPSLISAFVISFDMNNLKILGTSLTHRHTHARADKYIMPLYTESTLDLHLASCTCYYPERLSRAQR